RVLGRSSFNERNRPSGSREIIDLAAVAGAGLHRTTYWDGPLRCALSGAVKTAAGEAVYRAVVRGTPPPNPSEQVRTATTDVDGRFYIAEVVPGVFSVTASAPGYLPYTVIDARLCVSSSSSTFDAVLEAGGVPLSGTVSDLLGGPVAGATVSAVG